MLLEVRTVITLGVTYWKGTRGRLGDRLVEIMF